MKIDGYEVEVFARDREIIRVHARRPGAAFWSVVALQRDDKNGHYAKIGRRRVRFRELLRMA